MRLGIVHKAEVASPVRGWSFCPASVGARRPVRETQILIIKSFRLGRCGKGAWTGRVLQTIGAQFLDGGEPLVLMHGIPGQEEAEQIPHTGIVRHVVETRDLQAAL